MSEHDGGSGAHGRSFPPEVEIVTIGDELLLGQTVDANAAWLGRTLAAAGIRTRARATVGDDEGSIVDAVTYALHRTGTVVCTGGLGPTADDRTKPAVATVFGRQLVLDPEVLSQVRARFEIRGLPMPEINRGQAEVPEGAVVFPNPRGTAPGLALTDRENRLAVLLPGVPLEMRGLVEDHVLPFLEQRWPRGRSPIVHRILRTTGVAESSLAELMEDVVGRFPRVSVAFLPSPTGVDLRLTCWGDLPAAEAEAELDRAEAEMRGRAGPVVYAVGSEDLTTVVAGLLHARGLTLAVAESCTGGLLAKRLTDTPGASEYFAGGVVAYADAVKRDLLGVRTATLQRYGAVSAETAQEMAEGARARLGSGAALAITGVAGPGGGSEEKPVGTVFLALAGPRGVSALGQRFPGDRTEIRERSAQAALDLLRRTLAEEEP